MGVHTWSHLVGRLRCTNTRRWHGGSHSWRTERPDTRCLLCPDARRQRTHSGRKLAGRMGRGIGADTWSRSPDAWGKRIWRRLLRSPDASGIWGAGDSSCQWTEVYG